MWPLTSHWQVFGYDYYDLTHHHAVNQYTGLSYDTCCWAFRVIMATAYTGAFQINNGQTLQNQYDTTYYIQFLLKGLGTAGNREAKSMLTATLPGFEDTFSNNAQNTYNQHF
ncbi:MAG: organic solvent tolerance protein [uncultured bacterium]|nr:MAG: organic solvent tolerance protein [uncultured bacterium]